MLILKEYIYALSMLSRESLKQEKDRLLVLLLMPNIQACYGAYIYTGTKKTVVAFTRTLAIEYVKESIRANCISPFITWTSMHDDIRNEPVWKQSEQGIPLRHEPEGIAYAALFLASDESKFIKGVNLPVDGEFTVKDGSL